MTTHHTPPTRCPRCGYHLNCATGVQVRPRPGDYAVCAHCGTYLQYGAGLVAMLLTAAALAPVSLEAMTELCEARRQVEQLNRKHGPRCPTCNTRFDWAKSRKRARPRKGDVAVCMACGEFLRMLDPVTAGVLSAEALAALPREVQQALAEARAQIARGDA